ncbi:MAG: BamA/TamA family outer membrane protein [bacterium]|nr:BamA/TamA family outer membrane protein [bacterium]
MHIILFFLLTIEGFKVKHIEFYGNRSFSDKKLKEIVHTREGKLYDEFQSALDEKRLVSFYRNRGFKEAKVTEWKKNIINFEKRLIECKVYIEEGQRSYISGIKFEGNRTILEAQLSDIVKLKSGDPLDEERIFIAKYALTSLYADIGYAYTEVEHKLIPISTYEDTVCFQINEHKEVRFGNIRIIGNKGVRDEIIMREIIFEKGALYSPKKLYESQVRIYGTDLFESVKFELQGIEANRDTIDVIFWVKEKLPKWTAFGVGYGSPNRTWLNIGWGHDNLWGNGQRLEAQSKYELDPFELNKLQKLDVNIAYLEPYFLNTSVKAQLKPFYKFYKVGKNTSYELSYMGIEGRLGKYIGKFCQSFISYNYEIVREEGSVPKEARGEIVNSVLFSVAWDTRDNIFYPMNGYISAFSYEYAGRVLGGAYKFSKFTYDFSLYSQFLKSVIGTRLKFGGIVGETPLERRFILGGANTVRGYTDMLYTPEWKNWIGVANLELRIPTFKKFELAYFIDVGNVWTKKEDIRIQGLKIGAGFGVRYHTPIGPVRIDYGHKIVEAKQDKGRLYLAIGYMF